jgi:hypothetical protein
MLASFLQAKDAIPSPPSRIAIEAAGSAAHSCKTDEAMVIVAN